MSCIGLLMEAGNCFSINKPQTIQIPPIIEIHSKARFNPGSAAGLVGSVAVSICKLTIDNDTLLSAYSSLQYP